MSETKPFVSVVTPVHNTGKYLGTCIESVLCQDYDNWEYMIVNNKSTDDSRAVAAAYARKDERIRIVDTGTLLPQQVNYNFALRQIAPASKYCKVVQADDWLYPNCLRAMVEVAETDARIAVVNAYTKTATWVSGLGLACGDSPMFPSSVLPARDVCRLFLLQNCYLFGTPTSLLYRSDLIRGNDPFYVEDSQFGDSEACFEVLDGHLFAFVHQILSHSRARDDSITTRIRNFNPYEHHRYIFMKKYGQRYLTPEEHQACLRKDRAALYHAMASNMFRRRGKEYWEFQRMLLECAGEKLNWSQLYWLQIPRILNMIGNPKSTLEKIMRCLFTRAASGPKVPATKHVKRLGEV